MGNIKIKSKFGGYAKKSNGVTSLLKRIDTKEFDLIYKKEKDMPGILINTTNSPVKQKHICYFTTQEGQNIVLHEVVDRFYEHPNSEGMALIQRIEIDRLKEVNRVSFEAAALKLLEYTQQNVTNIERYIKEDEWCTK